MINQILTNDWQEVLGSEFQKPYYLNLCEFLKEEMETQTVFPDINDIYNALHFTSFEKVKVVILGQDPYHGYGQSHGLCFSVKLDTKQPPSLKNIFKELKSDIGCAIPTHGHLKSWSDQGVLLLNTTLTVRESEAGSHFNKGWENFTDRIIEAINEKSTPVVFILWGKPAQLKKRLIDTNKHFVLEAVHPSPLSAYRGFFGSRPFSKANEILRQTGQECIDWQIK
jgi:uracil-DNA glycosylase